MKVRPIPFSAPMVRALLAGAKTQTRRIARLKPTDLGKPLADDEFAHGIPLKTCPYGQPGDRLWVREAWRSGKLTDRFPPREMTPHPVWYEADGQAPEACNGKLRPAMFMPRWASRITLEVTGVRVERLQDISEADAKAEGCERLDEDEPGFVQRHEPEFKLCPQCGGTRLYTAFAASGGALPDTDCLKCDTYAKRYRHLWEAINGPGSWDANPWVWVVSFRRIEV